jgi:hypothetical protein
MYRPSFPEAPTMQTFMGASVCACAIYRLATSKPVMNRMTTMGNHTMRSHLLGVKV